MFQKSLCNSDYFIYLSIYFFKMIWYWKLYLHSIIRNPIWQKNTFKAFYVLWFNLLLKHITTSLIMGCLLKFCHYTEIFSNFQTIETNYTRTVEVKEKTFNILCFKKAYTILIIVVAKILFLRFLILRKYAFYNKILETIFPFYNL